ncbi:hypothetical protein GCM10027341_33070 [Spirosoma knui]
MIFTVAFPSLYCVVLGIVVPDLLGTTSGTTNVTINVVPITTNNKLPAIK